jgi:hypothetical protein
MSKNEKTTKQTQKDLKFQNDQKWPIKYTFLYPGGHKQSLYIYIYMREQYLWHTWKNDMSSKSGAWWREFLNEIYEVPFELFAQY